jgi:Domain of unknown function (DUF4268)
MQRLGEVAPGWLSPTHRVPTTFTLDLPSGRRGTWYNLQFTQAKAPSVTLFVTDSVGYVGDKAFDLLRQERQEIEHRFSGPLVWDDRVQGRARTDIAAVREGEADVERTSEWDEYRDWLVETAVRFRNALHPAIEGLGS